MLTVRDINIDLCQYNLNYLLHTQRQDIYLRADRIFFNLLLWLLFLNYSKHVNLAV